VEQFFVRAGKLNLSGCDFCQWPHRLFKISAVQDWLVIVTNPKLIDEISRAPEEVFSAALAVDEVPVSPKKLSPGPDSGFRSFN